MSSFTSTHTSSSPCSPSRTNTTPMTTTTQPMVIASPSRRSSTASTSSQNFDYFNTPYHLSASSSSTVHPIPYSSSMLRKQSQTHSPASPPSAYISDEDLFGDGSGYLTEPPPPPRAAEAWLARPLLPPVTAVDMGRSSKARRRSSAAAKERREGKGGLKVAG